MNEFKINMIDLSYENIWKNSKGDYQTINCIKDLIHLGDMIKKRSNSYIVIILP